MQPKVFQFLISRPDLLHFVRMNPYWYRILTRDPEQIQHLDKAAKPFYGKTISQKVGKINQQVSMLHMLLSMTEAMKERNK
ncbi:YlbE-like family protein [Salirhabdus salicampi]|uniref:YlbE-like family protein n=1 Tax=Salirhabdus salicampi TaxID=476102 RepID=UPI0020C266DA|nr:YlbE-like family protein [Salirhabdus salicampi]